MRFTVKDLSEHFKVSENTIRRWARTGKLPKPAQKKHKYIWIANSIREFHIQTQPQRKNKRSKIRKTFKQEPLFSRIKKL